MTFEPTPFAEGREEHFTKLSETFQRLVGRALDAVLAPYAFRLALQRGFGVTRDGLVQYSALYEAAPDEYARRYPDLDARWRGDVGCIDLWIVQDPRTGTLAVTIEGEELVPLLREIGAASVADEIEVAASSETYVQLSALARALTTVFDRFDRG